MTGYFRTLMENNTHKVTEVHLQLKVAVINDVKPLFYFVLFDSRQQLGFSFPLYRVPTGSRAHPASEPLTAT
jgi:hypothetical protein